MIRLITRKRLTVLDAERGPSRDGQADAAWSLFLAEREVIRLREELTAAQRTVTSLREEVVELVGEVRAAEDASRQVAVLTRQGEIHSVHGSPEAAQAAAVRHGARDGTWQPIPPGVPLAVSSWRITPAFMNTPLPGVHGDADGVHGRGEVVHGDEERVHGPRRAAVGGGVGG